jgi:triosephosphate isomerase
MPRTPLVAGNWKMNHLVGTAVETAKALVELAGGVVGADIVICPAFTSLKSVADVVKGSRIQIGAQNCYIKESGAFTGEVSPQMLLDVGCTWTIIGHSERRQYFQESDEFLNEKAKVARAAGLKVMFCIGETLEERNSGRMNEVLTRQVSKGLQGLGAAEFEGFSIAYEPVWAIGTGVTATPQQAQEAHSFVRDLVRKQFGETVASSLRIQYGGSVKPDNAGELMARPDVDGSLVGGASLTAESFAAIVHASV